VTRSSPPSALPSRAWFLERHQPALEAAYGDISASETWPRLALLFPLKTNPEQWQGASPPHSLSWELQ
jgi:hypothetical protein